MASTKIYGMSLFSQIVLLCFTAYLFFNGKVPIGAIGGVQYFAATIFSSLTGMNANIVEMNSIKAIFEKFKNYHNENKPKVRGNCTLGKLEKQITIQNVGYKYSNSGKYLFQNINFIINKGEKIVITGDSGCGKSTFLKIIRGTLNAKIGNVFWDNVPYNVVGADSLGCEIGYISQTPHLFNTTIRENILLGQSELEDKLPGILEELGLKEWITSLDSGINTIIQYGGKNLSGGQKQRIILARWLIRTPSLLLMDETTSSLDADSAKEIEKIVLAQQDLTVVMVTHRLFDESKRYLSQIIEF